MNKKIPVRLCLGCNEGHPKKELIRIVKTKEGEISVDITGKKSGRGAYICNKVECLNKLEKSKRLNRSFSMEIPPEVYTKLREELSDATE